MSPTRLRTLPLPSSNKEGKGGGIIMRTESKCDYSQKRLSVRSKYLYVLPELVSLLWSRLTTLKRLRLGKKSRGPALELLRGHL